MAGLTSPLARSGCSWVGRHADRDDLDPCADGRLNSLLRRYGHLVPQEKTLPLQLQLHCRRSPSRALTVLRIHLSRAGR